MSRALVSAALLAALVAGVPLAGGTVSDNPPAPSIDSGPADPTNGTSATFTFSDTDLTVSFRCQLDGGGFSPCVSPAVYSGLADGRHTFDVKAVDPAANESAVTSRSWTVDTAPPPAPKITAKPDNPSNDPTPTFRFSDSESGATFRCRLDGGAFTTCSSPQSYPALADGPHTFDVEAVDAAGNASGPSSYAWTLDTVAPPAPVISSKPLNPTNDPTPTFVFSDAEAGVTFDCKLDSGAFAACTSPKSYGALADGSHSFVVRAGDAAGNEASSSYSWTIDTTPPPVPTITSRPANPSNDTSPTFGFADAEGGATFECKLDSGAFSACTSPKTYTGVTPNTDHTFSVRAVDALQNKSVGASYTWTIDTDPPGVIFDSTPPNLSNDSTPTFAFHADEPSTFACKLDGQVFSPCTSPNTLPSTADGPHTFTVRATDLAGNSAQASRTWTIDATRPSLSITQKPPNPSGVAAAHFEFSATDKSSVTFQCQLDNLAAESCTSPKDYSNLSSASHTFTLTATDAAGNATTTSYTWLVDTANPVVTIQQGPPDPTNQTAASFSFQSNKNPSTFQCVLDSGTPASCTSPASYTSLSAGTHTFSVTATDSLGHTGQPTGYTWLIDLTPPVAPSIAGGPASPTRSTSASFVFSDSEAGLSFGCRLDGDAFTSCTSPVSYSKLADGRHTFSVRATDRAGNVGSAASYAWTVDTVAPDTTITSRPAAVSSTDAATFQFASSESGSTFACSLDGGAFTACSSPRSYSALADGRHTFKVRASDAAGNVDPTPAEYSWQVATLIPPDTTPPGAVVGLRRSVGYGTLALAWGLPTDTDFDHVVVLRSRSASTPPRKVVYEGRGGRYRDTHFKNGTYYRYAIVSYDHAGNASRSVSVAVPPSVLLRSPRNASVVKTPPRLMWTGVPKATFYNVQLYYGSQKVLSAWPSRDQLMLKRVWTYAGRWLRLRKGGYRWYVWPAFGPRSKSRYGQLLGQGTFTVR